MKGVLRAGRFLPLVQVVQERSFVIFKQGLVFPETKWKVSICLTVVLTPKILFLFNFRPN